ncbi:MAG TPA: DUF3795 domain-containing protein [Bacteroidales bacterium]|jgi:hypothetical protein|nr:DUF3795 domain-containing protein [Bacteroidales bacterium]
MNISACGLICDNCQFFNKECTGCHQTKGKPFWTAFQENVSVCPLYDCSVNKKNLKDCGGCNELPCKLFYNLKDPNTTEEQHLESIKTRVSVLKS